jgi:beta-N-acetylhexosaminidase
MTGHLLVPELDDTPATISRPILSGLLRGELGFDGLIVTDALEMRGISGTIGVPEAAVLALTAGADALCLGHDLHEEAVEQVHAAIVGAVRAGRLQEERVAEAAERVAAVCRWASPTDAGAGNGSVGLDAARRALESSGSVTVAAPILVLELVPEANIAAGEAEHGLGDLLPGAVTLRFAAPPRDLAAVIAQYPDRRLVLVVRDAARHPWQQDIVAGAAALRPDAVVVETGIPGGSNRLPSIVTYGAGRANLAAAAEALGGADSLETE